MRKLSATAGLTCASLVLVGSTTIPSATGTTTSGPVSAGVPGASSAEPAAGRRTGEGPALAIRGDVRRPQLLTRRALATFEQQEVTATYTAGGVPTTATFTDVKALRVVDLGRG